MAVPAPTDASTTVATDQAIVSRRWPKLVSGADRAQLGEPSGEMQEVAESAAYEPRRRDWQHLDALLELLEERGRISDGAIGAKLGVSHTAVWRWKRRPGFEAWLNSQLQARTEQRKTFVLARAFALAMRGSIRHMDYLAKILGWYQQPDGGTDRPTVNVVLGRGLRERG